MVDNFIKLEKGKYIFLRNLIQRSKVEWPKRSRNVEKGSLANHCHLLVFYTKNLCVKPRYFVETEQKEQQFHYRHCNFYLVVNLDYWKPLYTFAWKEKKTLTGLKFGKKGCLIHKSYETYCLPLNLNFLNEVFWLFYKYKYAFSSTYVYFEKEWCERRVEEW